MNTDAAKRTLFQLWVKTGKVLIAFDSGHIGVNVPAVLFNDPEMWAVCMADTCTVFEEGVQAEVELEDGSQIGIYVPWAAIYQIDVDVLRESHAWIADQEAAMIRFERGNKKEFLH